MTLPMWKLMWLLQRLRWPRWWPWSEPQLPQQCSQRQLCHASTHHNLFKGCLASVWMRRATSDSLSIRHFNRHLRSLRTNMQA